MARSVNCAATPSLVAANLTVLSHWPRFSRNAGGSPAGADMIVGGCAAGVVGGSVVGSLAPPAAAPGATPAAGTDGPELGTPADARGAGMVGAPGMGDTGTAGLPAGAPEVGGRMG